MKILQVYRRLEAFRAGRPLPLGETLHLPLAAPEETLIVAFVRMGGESSPWGVAWKLNREPRVRVLTVSEPRDRELVARMMADFAPALAGHVGHPKLWKYGRDGDLPFRQLWLPNPTHLDMLHLLASMLTQTERSDDARQNSRLRALGRASGWLFREAQRPGQVRVVVATRALREAFTFPVEDLRQGHLGFLLAWLQTEGESSDRLAAAREAEEEPIATSLDPTFERQSLLDPVQRYNQAKDTDDEEELEAARQNIHELLEAKILHRIELSEAALELLRADERPVNPGTDLLIKRAIKEHQSQYLYFEKRLASPHGPRWVPSAETDDHPAAAGARYHEHTASAEEHAFELLHHDRQMQLDAIFAGHAFRGTIIVVRDEGEGNKSRPVWMVEDSHETPLRLRQGSDVCVAGLRGRKGKIRSVSSTPAGNRVFEIAMTGGTKAVSGDAQSAPAAADPELVGSEVTMVAVPAAGISRTKAYKVWQKDGPGAWLTHE